MSRDLTPQQRDYITARLEGLEHISAVKKAYPNLTRGSAYVIGCRLKKNIAVQSQLKEGTDALRGRLFDKTGKFIDVLKQMCPPIEVAKKLAELMFSDDQRVADSAIEKYLKLASEYPSEKIGLFRAYEEEREKILSPADIPRLIIERQAEEQRKKVLEDTSGGKEKLTQLSDNLPS